MQFRDKGFDENNDGRGKGQIDQGVDQFLVEKLVAHQDPGDRQAEHRVDQRTAEGGEEGQLIRRQDSRRGDDVPERIPAQRS